MKKTLIVAIAAASLLLVGCATDGAAPPMTTTSTSSTTSTTTTTVVTIPSSGLASGCYNDGSRSSFEHSGLAQRGNSVFFLSLDCTGSVLDPTATVLSSTGTPEQQLAACVAVDPTFTVAQRLGQFPSIPLAYQCF